MSLVRSIQRSELAKFWMNYMRRLRGKCKDSNSETKFVTEFRELRSRAITVIREWSIHSDSDTIRAFASSAALRSRAGMTILAPRLANTLAVSSPIPDVAPAPKFVSDRIQFNMMQSKFWILNSKKITCDYGGDGVQMRTCLSDLVGGGFGTVAACSGGTDEVLEDFKHGNGRGWNFEVGFDFGLGNMKLKN